jgi:hypothetical protein
VFGNSEQVSNKTRGYSSGRSKEMDEQDTSCPIEEEDRIDPATKGCDQYHAEQDALGEKI